MLFACRDHISDARFASLRRACTQALIDGGELLRARQLAETHDELECLALLAADDEPLLRHYLATRPDFARVLYRHYANEPTLRARLFEQSLKQRDAVAQFLAPTPALAWLEHVRWQEYDAASGALLTAARAERVERERVRPTGGSTHRSPESNLVQARALYSTARLAARAASDGDSERAALAGLELLRLGDVLRDEHQQARYTGGDADPGADAELDAQLFADSERAVAAGAGPLPLLLTPATLVDAAWRGFGSLFVRARRVATVLHLAQQAELEMPAEAQQLEASVWRQVVRATDWSALAARCVAGELNDTQLSAELRRQPFCALASVVAPPPLAALQQLAFDSETDADAAAKRMLETAYERVQ